MAVYISDIAGCIRDTHKYRVFISDNIYNVILITKCRFNVNRYNLPNKNSAISISKQNRRNNKQCTCVCNHAISKLFHGKI